MKIIEKGNGKVEYHPSEGYRFIKKDRTMVVPWFITLREGDSFDTYEEVSEAEALLLEDELIKMAQQNENSTCT